MNDRARWNERYRAGAGPTRVNPRLQKYLYLLKHGVALDLAGGIGQNVQLLAGWNIVLADLAEEALQRAHHRGARVQADAAALPFAPNSFDTIICTYFYEPRADYHALLVPSGTLFFETYTLADAKYRPDLNPAHRFNPAQVSSVLKGLEILLFEESDDGQRAFATVVARKPGA